MTEGTKNWAVGMGIQLGQAVNMTLGLERSFGQGGKPQLRIGVQTAVPMPQSEGGGGATEMGRPAHLSVPKRDSGTGDTSTGSSEAAASSYVSGDARVQITAAMPVAKNWNVLAGMFGGVSFAWNSNGSSCSGGYGCGGRVLKRDSGDVVASPQTRTTGASELVGGLVGLEAGLGKNVSFDMGIGVAFSPIHRDAVWPELGMHFKGRF